jgi:hypothetical protein
MTAKEKAEELLNKMIYHIEYNCQPSLKTMIAKQCALIAVDEILSAIGFSVNDEYWGQVKQEIEKL